MSETTFNKILRAAGECFSKDGFDGTTMDVIAKNAGVSKGALYWYFKNKEELFVKLKEQNVTQVLQTLERLFASVGTFDSKLIKSSELYFSPLTPEHRRTARLNMEFWAASPKISGLERVLNEQYKRLQTFLQSAINEAVKKGEIRKDVDPESLSTILLAALDGLELHWTILGRDFDWQKIRTTFCEVILNGLKPQKGVED
jgi:AcrR family transcriptional regulator